jgi:hypothetical protein
VDKNLEIANKYNVVKIPSMAIFYNSKRLNIIIGVKQKNPLKKT